MKHESVLQACVAVMGLMAMLAEAQSYPARPVRVIVPFPAGATADLAARMIYQDVSDRLGHQFVIDNRSGGSTIIGTDITAKAPPDGYTLVNAPFNYAANPFLFKKLPYDPVKDLKPVVLLGLTPLVLVVHPSVKATSLKEFIALAGGANPRFNYATAGEGSSNHLATELFKMRTKVDMTHIPYKGAAPGVTAVASGEVPVMLSGLTSALGQIQAGRLRAIAMASVKRSVALPSVPTMEEGGLKGCEVSAWHGTMVAAKTPPAVIAKLNAEVVRTLRVTAIADKLIGIGFEPEGGTPEDFGRFIQSEMEKWSAVVRTAKITAGE